MNNSFDSIVRCLWDLNTLTISFILDDLVNVYEWRIQQERALWQAKNQGMTDDEVVKFVIGYMSAYELYLDQLRHGFFRGHIDCEQKEQLSVLLDKNRKAMEMTVTSQLGSFLGFQLHWREWACND